jgi:EAL domain-containing protein (putative c-di-GMP-specific phosphodiesterase class I)
MTAETVRQQRDRFVAFAFAGADVLIELDRDGVVRFAAGAVLRLDAGGEDALLGRRIEELVAPSEQDAMRAFLGDAGGGVARRTRRFSLRDGTGAPLAARVSGYRLPDMGDHAFLSVAFAAPYRGAGAKAVIPADSFTARAAQRLSEACRQEGDFSVTVLDLGGLDEVAERADAARIDGFLDDVVERLRGHSEGGDAVSRFAADRFGVLHRREEPIEQVVEQIESDSRALDPEHRGVTVARQSLPLEPDGLSEGDAVRALVYALDRIGRGGALDLATLRTSYDAMLEDALGRMRSFRKLVQTTDFEVAIQPIVGLANGKIHHYEALARFPDAAAGASPFELITFAEDTGLVAEFDLAMCARVLDLVKAARPGAPAVAVNVSTRSLESAGFVERLCALTDSHPGARDRLMFEITESARITDMGRANDMLQRLRRAGFAVCLDDFGVGATNLDYLRMLKVDYVKIDGSYIKTLPTTPHAKAFLSAIVQLCRQLDIETVAECVETRQVAAIFKDAGVTLGQGFLYGRPEIGALGAPDAAPAPAPAKAKVPAPATT